MAGAFDTHKVYLELTNGDRFEHAQAEALIALVNGAVVGSVATKSDLEVLGNKLEDMKNYLLFRFVLAQAGRWVSSLH